MSCTRSSSPVRFYPSDVPAIFSSHIEFVLPSRRGLLCRAEAERIIPVGSSRARSGIDDVLDGAAAMRYRRGRATSAQAWLLHWKRCSG